MSRSESTADGKGQSGEAGASAGAGDLGETIRVGASACLLGEQVRYDGGHKRSRFVVDRLGQFVELVGFCPEVELGLGVPRETIRLERAGAGARPVGEPSGRPVARLIAPKSGRDLTRAMERLAEERCGLIAAQDLSGYVLKKGSPSCGMERVGVYDANGVPARDGRGAFARVLMARFPHLPVEEEGRLEDPVLRERFVVRIFAYQRVRALFAREWTIGDLVRFHTGEKLLLLAHAPPAYRRLGVMVAEAKGRPRQELADEYFDAYMSALEVGATRPKNVNALQHAAGHCKRRADAADRVELASVIETYGAGQVPLVVPITLLRHFVRRYEVTYLEGQRYLEPHPRELGLRNDL